MLCVPTFSRIILSTVNIWNNKRLNKLKEEQCEREGITPDQWEKFQDMGNESPLFRFDLLSLLLQCSELMCALRYTI